MTSFSGLPRPGNSGGGLTSGSLSFGDAARRAGYQHQSRSRRRRRRPQQAHLQLIALSTSLSLAPSSLVMTRYTHRRCAVAVAHGARNGDLAAQFRRHLACTFSHALRDGAGSHARFTTSGSSHWSPTRSLNEASERASGPLRGFMEKNVAKRICGCSWMCRARKRRKSQKIFRCASSRLEVRF